MANAAIGLGIAVQLAAAATPTVKTTMGKVFDITATPVAKFDQVESSTYDQGNSFKQYITGLADPGEFSFDMNYIPASATDVYLQAAQGTPQVAYVTLPDGSSFSFSCVITDYGPNKLPIDGKMTATCKCKVSGQVTYVAPSAPVNVLKPSVIGSSLVNGATFTADVGQWAPAGTSYTYVWNRDGTPIGGATALTYLTVAGDVGHAISVTVTATNATGSASATSLKTANIT